MTNKEARKILQEVWRNERNDYGFGIKVTTHCEGAWSFGSCISHSFGETYLFINFAKWSISIGWLMKEGTE